MCLYTVKWLNSSIWSKDGTLRGTAIPGQREPGINGNEGVLHIFQSSRTEASTSRDLVSHLVQFLDGRVLTSSTKMQSAYSTTPADLTETFLVLHHTAGIPDWGICLLIYFHFPAGDQQMVKGVFWGSRVIPTESELPKSQRHEYTMSIKCIFCWKYCQIKYICLSIYISQYRNSYNYYHQ